MKNFNPLVLILTAATLTSSFAYAEAEDDPLLTTVILDQLEKGVKSDSPTSFNAQALVGYDLNKLWLKAKGQYTNSSQQDLELQALYSHAVTTYWNMQMGLRRDLKPSPSRNWAVFGVQGLAPYFFDTNVALFVGEEGRTALRLSTAQDWLMTQRLILTPDFEMNAYGKNDKALGIGSGVSDISVGLRLRYEIVRKFAPYMGLSWSKKVGKTADIADNNGQTTSDTQFVIGVKAWF
jgi:copper resistance protein B